MTDTVIEDIKTPRLTDAVARAQAHPETFFIPGAAEREALEAGHVVKLIFDEMERMWVTVREVRRFGGNTRYVGALSNTPVDVADLAHGDFLYFEPKHVTEIADERAPTGILA